MNNIYAFKHNNTKLHSGTNLANFQCCSHGQNPKAKDEAKARTLKAEVKAWTLEAKTKTKAWTLQAQGLDPWDQDQGQNFWVQGQFQGQIWLTI